MLTAWKLQKCRIVTVGLAALAIGCAFPLRVMADAPDSFNISPALAMADTKDASDASTVRTEHEKSECMKECPLPIKLSVSYYLLSDRVFRGIVVSEFKGEGREKPNHQLHTSFSWDAKEWGTFGFNTFFEWYSAHRQINAFAGGQHEQEMDFIPWWRHSIDPICTDITLGYIFKEFPRSAALFRNTPGKGNNNDDHTQEWYFELNHNDAWMWKWLFCDNEEGVLNPRFYFGQDVGVGAGAVWMELGISHTFKVPCVDNLTITPGYTITADGGYLKRIEHRTHPGHLRLGYELYSLDITYDLTPIMHLPPWAGKVSISGLLNWGNALGTAEADGTLKDVLFGGMSVNWTWGGG